MEPNSNTPTSSSNNQTPNLDSLNKIKMNKTLLLVVGLIILTVLLLVISISGRINTPISNLVNQGEESNTQTVLSLSSDIRENIDGKYELDVNIDTGEDEVSSAQIEISYDPDALSEVEIAPGGFLEGASIIDQTVDEVNGKITLVLGSSLESEPVKGAGVIAIISFVKNDDSETTLEFLPETVVSSGGKNVLSETESAIISSLPDSTETSEENTEE